MKILQTLILVFLFASKGWSLYLNAEISALKLPANTSIKIDGKPDSIWWAIAAKSGKNSIIDFQDYSKIVLLTNDSVRNLDPAKVYASQDTGNIGLLAAYDNNALYLLFIVHTKSTFNGSNVCTDSNTTAWKGDMVQVFLDPNSWDTSLYKNYFSADEAYAVFGTSLSSIEIDRPLYGLNNLLIYKDRIATNRFVARNAKPSGLSLTRLRNSSQVDSNAYAIEMKIPFWGNNPSAFKRGGSMYISWGYNNYLDSMKNDCSDQPIAYRWAKHYKNYDTYPLADRPAGFILHDSTHFDPTRSGDGWGRLVFDSTSLDPKICRNISIGKWDISTWAINCSSNTTELNQMVMPPLMFENKAFLRQENDALGRKLILQGNKKERSNPLLSFP